MTDRMTGYIKFVAIGAIVSGVVATMTSLLSLLVVGLMLLVYAAAEEKAYSVELNEFDKNPKFEDDIKWIDWGDLRMKKAARNKFTLTGSFDVNMNMGDEQKVSPGSIYRLKRQTELIYF